MRALDVLLLLVLPSSAHRSSASGKRAYIAGTLPNTPANMQRWVQHPQEVKPNNAMPEVPVTDEDARDMVAYLFTLE